MSSEINLLYNKKQAQNTKLTARVRILRLFAMGILFLVSMFSIVLFLLVLASPLPSLSKKEDIIVNSLNQSHEVILKQTLLSTRLSEIDGIISKRSKYTSLITAVQKDFPADGAISQLSFEKKTVHLSFSAGNLDDITKYLDSLRTQVKNKENFSNVYVNNIAASHGEGNTISSFIVELLIVLK